MVTQQSAVEIVVVEHLQLARTNWGCSTKCRGIQWWCVCGCSDQTTCYLVSTYDVGVSCSRNQFYSSCSIRFEVAERKVSVAASTRRRKGRLGHTPNNWTASTAATCSSSWSSLASTAEAAVKGWSDEAASTSCCQASCSAKADVSANCGARSTT